MRTETVIQFFGTKTAIARTLGISQVAVTRWGDIVPEKRAARLERLTNGALVYDPQSYQSPAKSA